MAIQTDNIPDIKINGKSLQDYVFIDVLLNKEMLKPNELHFSLRKKSSLKNASDISFEIADALIGAKVECRVVAARRDESEEMKNEKLAFNGIIFSISTQRDTMGMGMFINCIAYSPDYLLVDNPHCCSFEEQTLSEIINKSVEDYSGTLNADIDAKMTDIIPYTVQYNETTYQFLSRLARRYGEFFYFEDDKLVFGKMKRKESVALYPDTDILGYNYELNLDHANFVHACHDYLRYENLSENAYDYSKDSLNKMSDYAYDHSKKLYHKKTLQDYRAAVQEDNGIEQVEESVKTQSLCAKTQMAVCKAITNRCDLKLGSIVVIQEYADQDGELEIKKHEELIVCALRYSWDINGHFESEITAIPAGTEYPPYYDCDVYPLADTQRAIVRDNRDPEKLGRVRVQFLWQDLQDESMITPWIRMAQPHGGDNKGFYFIPEIDEEVMVGFENGNADKPYVIGTLYHGKQHPGSNWYSDSNDIKAIRTRNGHTVEIHDVGNDGYIRIYDNEKENYILTFSTDEKLIKLESTGNIELYAENDIIMHAKHDIKMTADNDMTVDVGNDRTTNIGNDDSESVGNDQGISVGNNQTLTVSEEQNISVDGSSYTKIGETYSLNATDIMEEASEKIGVYSNTHEQKADSTMKINAGTQIDIKAEIVKINS